jgi:hypothetical protein
MAGYNNAMQQSGIFLKNRPKGKRTNPRTDSPAETFFFPYHTKIRKFGQRDI